MTTPVERSRMFVRLLLYVLSSDPEIEVDNTYNLPLYKIKGKIIKEKPVLCWSCGSLCKMKLLTNGKWAKFPSVFPYKGTDDDEKMTLGHDISAAVFRILKRPSEGYLPSNIAWQCKDCNDAQSTLNNQQFQDFLLAAQKVSKCSAIRYCSMLPKKNLYLDNIQRLIHYIWEGKITSETFIPLMMEFIKRYYFPPPPTGKDISWWHASIQEIITAMYLNIAISIPKNEKLPWNFQVLRYTISTCIKSTSPICEIDVPDLPDLLPDRFFLQIQGKKYPFSCATYEEIMEHTKILIKIVLQGVKIPSSLVPPTPAELEEQLAIIGTGTYAGY